MDKVNKGNPLNTDYLKTLHKEMYGNVWKWTGEFRQSEHNIGIKYYRIRTKLEQLKRDIQYQVDHEILSPLLKFVKTDNY